MNDEHLKKEMGWFEDNRTELLKLHEGKWIVVYNQKQIGIYETFGEAYSDGIEKTKSEELLVKQITEKDELLYVFARVG